MRGARILQQQQHSSDPSAEHLPLRPQQRRSLWLAQRRSWTAHCDSRWGWDPRLGGGDQIHRPIPRQWETSAAASTYSVAREDASLIACKNVTGIDAHTRIRGAHA